MVSEMNQEKGKDSYFFCRESTGSGQLIQLCDNPASFWALNRHTVCLTLPYAVNFQCTSLGVEFRDYLLSVYIEFRKLQQLTEPYA